MRKLFPFVLFLLSACSDQSLEIDRWYHNTKIECMKEPVTRENVISKEACKDNALTVANQKLNSPIMWAVYARVTAGRNAAIAYAQGKISREQFDYITQMADAKYIELAAKSNQQFSAAQQQQQTAALLYIGQSLSPQPVAYPAYQLPMSCTTSYMHNLAQTNCY